MARAARILSILVVLAGAAAAGFQLASRLGPEQLEGRVRGWLEEVTGRPAEVADLRVVLGLPIRLEGTGLRLWDGGLTAESASARIDLVSLLLGRPRLTRLRLDGAHFQVERLPGGEWQPPVFHRDETREAEPALEPLRIIDGAIRLLLAKPFLADTLVVRRSRVTIRHPALDASGRGVRLELSGVNGRLMHSRLFGDAKLFLRLRVAREGGRGGTIEWDGSRKPSGGIEVTMAASGLDLAVVEPYLRALRPEAQLSGRVDGVFEFRSGREGVGALSVDLGAQGFAASLRGSARRLEVDPLSIRMAIDVAEDRLTLRDTRISAAELEFSLGSEVERPLGERSATRVDLTLAALSLEPERAQSWVDWLPLRARERFQSLVERLRSGRVIEAKLRGRSTLSDWSRLLAGDLKRLPEGLELSADVEGIEIEVDPENRLEDLRGRLAFQADTLEIAQASAVLNGGALPTLTLSIGGISTLLEAPMERRGMSSGARALVGVTPLWDVFRPQPDDAPSPPPRIALYFEHLDHPALLWPLRNVAVDLQLEPDSDGLRLEIRECRWAGVAIDGEVDWTLAPERHIEVRLLASTPDAADAPPEAPPDATAVGLPIEAGERPWAAGLVEVGPIGGSGWQQHGLSARFAAVGGELQLDEVAVDLVPRGRLTGFVELDLGHADRVPYAADLAIRDGDADAIAVLLGADSGMLTGQAKLDAQLEGSLVPGRPALHDADGRIALEVRDGTLRRSIPPVLALALASRSFNPFAARESVRFKQVVSRIDVAKGRLSTDALELDGPDLRVFVSGSVNLGERPPPIDLDVALFLFRQLDRAIEWIPLLNVLLLGENQNLVAAYFELVGTWADPVARPKPLRTIEEGPTEVITRGIPQIVTRGIKALGGLLRAPSPAPKDPPAATLQDAAEAPIPRSADAVSP